MADILEISVPYILKLNREKASFLASHIRQQYKYRLLSYSLGCDCDLQLPTGVKVVADEE